MIKKIKKYIIKDFKNNYKYYIFLLILSLLFIIKLDYYIYSPGGLVDLEKRIEVENAYKSEGSLNLTYVTSHPGNLINIILSYIIPSWDLVKVDESRIEDESTNEIEERDKIFLKQSSYDAVITAFKASNKEYYIKSIDLTVSYIYKSAVTNLKQGDIIQSINSVDINNFSSLKEEISKYKAGDKINISVKRNNKIVDCYSELIEENDRTIIGISISEIKSIETSPNVTFVFKDNESGSSRGLMCALDIYNKITKYDITGGKKIAGTGTIDENGNVGAISGVKYKLKGAVRKNADVFIVPSDNYKEAIKEVKKHNYKIKIIKAKTLDNVIEELKKLK